MFLSASMLQGTSDSKRGRIQKFGRGLGQKIIVNCTGIRADESPSQVEANPIKVIFDNGVGTTIQTESYAHHSEDAGRPARDYTMISSGGDTSDWDGNDGLRLDPSAEQRGEATRSTA